MLHDIARLIRTRADQLARGSGMTRAQWVILRHLDRQPGVSQNELAALIEVEPISVARLIDRLETRGLVERRADPKDRRLRRLHLTEAAAPILKDIGEHIETLTKAITDGIEAEKMKIFVECLLHVKSNLLAEMLAAQGAA